MFQFSDTLYSTSGAAWQCAARAAPASASRSESDHRPSALQNGKYFMLSSMKCITELLSKSVSLRVLCSKHASVPCVFPVFPMFSNVFPVFSLSVPYVFTVFTVFSLYSLCFIVSQDQSSQCFPLYSLFSKHSLCFLLYSLCFPCIPCVFPACIP